MPVYSGDPDYDTLVAAHAQQQGRVFKFNGQFWMRVQNGPSPYFVPMVDRELRTAITRKPLRKWFVYGGPQDD